MWPIEFYENLNKNYAKPSELITQSSSMNFAKNKFVHMSIDINFPDSKSLCESYGHLKLAAL